MSRNGDTPAPRCPLVEGDNEIRVVAALRDEAEGYAQRFYDAQSRHNQVEHLAGLSDHAIAQELINAFGSWRVLDAIATALSRNHPYFFDVICILIPNRHERIAFYTSIDHAGPNAKNVQKQRYIRLCEMRDTTLMYVPILKIPVLSTLVLNHTHRMLEQQEDGSLLAHHHFRQLSPAFNPSDYLPELAESGDNLKRLEEVESQRFSQEIMALCDQVAPFERRIAEMKADVRRRVEALWDPAIERAQDDLQKTDQPAFHPQDPANRKMFQEYLLRVNRHVHEIQCSCASAIREICKPLDDILQMLPPAIRNAYRPDPAQPDATRTPVRTGNNHHPRKNNRPSAPAPASLKEPGV